MSALPDEYIHLQVIVDDRTSPFRAMCGTVVSSGVLLGVRLHGYTPLDKLFAANVLIEKTSRLPLDVALKVPAVRSDRELGRLASLYAQENVTVFDDGLFIFPSAPESCSEELAHLLRIPLFAEGQPLSRRPYDFFSRVPGLILEPAIPKVIRSGVDELAHLLRNPRFVRGLEELTILNFDLDYVNIPNSAIMEVLSLVPFLPVLRRVYIHDVTDYSVGNMRLITPVGHKYSEPMRRATDLARMVEFVDRTRSCLPVSWWQILRSVQLFHLRDFTRCLPGAHEYLLYTADVWGFYAEQIHLRLVSFFFEAFNRPAFFFESFDKPVPLQTSQEKRRGFVKVHYCGPSHCSDSVAGNTATNIGLLASTNSMCAYEQCRLMGSKGRRIAQAILHMTNYNVYAYVFRVTDEHISWSWDGMDGRKVTVNVKEHVTTIDDGIEILFIDAQPIPPFDALVSDVVFTGEFFVRSSDEMVIDSDVSPFLLETFLRHPALLVEFKKIRVMDRANSDLGSWGGVLNNT